jgi:hypothetical protein
MMKSHEPPREKTKHSFSSVPNTPLRLGEGLADAGTALARVQTDITVSDSVGLLDVLLVLGEDELDVARVGHVGVDLEKSLSAVT